MSHLVPRTTLVQICAQRRRALDLYAEAYDALAAANAALHQAGFVASAAAPLRTNRYNHHTAEARKQFVSGIDVPEREAFIATARRLVDTDVWAHLIEVTDLERLMDKKAKDDFSQQLLQDPPEATEDNIAATLRQLALDADTIFRRGIATCFSGLDRRFRSHDGFKIGSRVVLTNAFDEWGGWNYYRNHRDTLQDIERTFFVLEGKAPPPNYAGIVGAVEDARKGGWGRRQSEANSDYFTVRSFKNGNAHVWFRRDDLVERVNKLLAEYYGEVIPDGQTAADDGGLHTPKTSLAKNYGFYPSPEPVAARVIDDTPLYRRDGEPPLIVLEPSAGTGSLARLAAGKGAVVDCVEIQPQLVEALKAERRYRRVLQADFLALAPDVQYDRIIMNPPFDRERDIDHVMHALRFLKPGGFLTAVMSAGTEFRETRKTVAFRALMDRMKAQWNDLPAGSFASVGTYCNTILLRVQTPTEAA